MAVGAAQNALAFSSESVSQEKRCHRPDLSVSATGLESQWVGGEQPQGRQQQPGGELGGGPKVTPSFGSRER